MSKRRALAATALCLWSATALGQAPPAGAECAPAESRAGESRSQEIAGLYQRFECHFARKEYAACLPYLERACGLTDSPRCLLNLGAVHHALMHCQRARGYYQQYLDRAPYDEDVDAARSALAELELACPQATAAPEASAAPLGLPPAAIAAPEPPAPAAPPPAAAGRPEVVLPMLQSEQPPAEHSPRRSPQRVLAWSLLGASAAGLAATAVTAAYGARAERDFEARFRDNGGQPRDRDPELRAIDERGQRYNQLALVFGVLSGVLGGAGTTLWLLDLPDGASLAVSAQGAASLRYGGSF